jgi:hypothetical protein
LSAAIDGRLARVRDLNADARLCRRGLADSNGIAIDGSR